MPAQRADYRRIKQHRSYNVAELAACCGVHKNTVRHWQRDGLAPVDDQRPALFHGSAARAFLAGRKVARKQPCPVGTLYCFRCRSPQEPAADGVEFVAINDTSGNIRAACAACGTIMHRRARADALAAILPNHAVQFEQGESRLKGRSPPSQNCDSERCDTT